jgi:uncharacterized membrane protein
MSHQWPIALTLHQLGTLIWVGGMLFAHTVLRPVANRLLEAPVRLPFLLSVFGRFFAFVWLSILLLWGSGLWILLGLWGGKAGPHVFLMTAVAALMTAIFAFIWLITYRRMRVALTAENTKAAGAELVVMRKLVFINLILGLVTAVLGAAGSSLLASLAVY